MKIKLLVSLLVALVVKQAVGMDEIASQIDIIKLVHSTNYKIAQLVLRIVNLHRVQTECCSLESNRQRVDSAAKLATDLIRSPFFDLISKSKSIEEAANAIGYNSINRMAIVNNILDIMIIASKNLNGLIDLAMPFLGLDKVVIRIIKNYQKQVELALANAKEALTQEHNAQALTFCKQAIESINKFTNIIDAEVGIENKKNPMSIGQKLFIGTCIFITIKMLMGKN